MSSQQAKQLEVELIKKSNVFLKNGDFEEAAKVLEQLIENPENLVASNFTRSLELCYTKLGKTDTLLTFYDRLVDYYSENGRWMQSAKQEIGKAQILEKHGRLEEALNSYEHAIRYYELDGSQARANLIYQSDLSRLAISLGRYNEANEHLFKYIGYAREDKLLKYTLKEPSFIAGLTLLVNGDVEKLNSQMDLYDLDGYQREFLTNRKCLAEIQTRYQNHSMIMGLLSKIVI